MCCRLLAILGMLLVLPAASQPAAGPPQLVPYRVAAKLPDVLTLPLPSEVRLDGYLGARVANNEKNRLLAVNEDELLAGFRSRPGKQAWIGEHVGKWLHAATLAWAYTGDAALRAKLDRVVTELLKTQEPDGYLGTYTPDKRFGLYPGADWDVWVHKYDLIGLLTYFQYTATPAALDASRKIGDLLIRTFGPGKKSILAAGTHVGMASTSVLEPVVLLYRTTGDERYLEFARYLVSSWDEPNGPKILSTLTTLKSVGKTANSKAYEMLSNLVGLCDLARVTGERRYMEPALNAWADIVAHHLYVTGSASHHEHFHADHDLPNHPGANVGETCVTVTWIQLNAQLLRLTGEGRFGDELERSYYNHLAAAQRPDGAQWCYYTALEGTKPYGPGINCCVSSGPRGMALAPQLTYLKYSAEGKDGLAVNLFETSQLTTQLGGQSVTVEQQTAFPHSGSSTLTLRMKKPARFGLRIRAPGWAAPLELRSPRLKGWNPSPGGGWVTVPPVEWKNGDQITLRFTLTGWMVEGTHGNAGRAALLWGPIVLAYDESKNPGLPPIASLALAAAARQELLTLKSAPGEPLIMEHQGVRSARDPSPRPALFVPFAEAGSTGSRYQIWLRGPNADLPKNLSLFAFSRESRSRQGNVAGAISDGDPATFVVTFDNQAREEDWFAVTLDAPVTVRRVAYAHGKTFHDGGWFDASAGKPRIQVKREKNGAWETVGILDEYPATTAMDPRGLKDGQTFAFRLKEPQRVMGIRVVGKPASGDNPRQAFASCAELQAFAD
jgi:uncharacterized protein